MSVFYFLQLPLVLLKFDGPFKHFDTSHMVHNIMDFHKLMITPDFVKFWIVEFQAALRPLSFIPAVAQGPWIGSLTSSAPPVWMLHPYMAISL